MDNVASGLEGSNKEETADGEAICFSGYVHLMFNKKDRGRLWAVLRSNRLTFHQSEDEVRNCSLFRLLDMLSEMSYAPFKERKRHSKVVQRIAFAVLDVIHANITAVLMLMNKESVVIEEQSRVERISCFPVEGLHPIADSFHIVWCTSAITHNPLFCAKTSSSRGIKYSSLFT